MEALSGSRTLGLYRCSPSINFCFKGCFDNAIQHQPSHMASAAAAAALPLSYIPPLSPPVPPPPHSLPPQPRTRSNCCSRINFCVFKTLLSSPFFYKHPLFPLSPLSSLPNFSSTSHPPSSFSPLSSGHSPQSLKRRN